MENWLKMQDKMNWKMDGGEMCVSLRELSYTRNQSQLKKNWKKILKCRCCVIKRERTRREKCTPGKFKNLFFVVKKKMKFIVCHFFLELPPWYRLKYRKLKNFTTYESYIKIYNVKKITK